MVVSNRGVCTFTETGGGISASPSVSGLVSALEPIISKEGGTWIAWGGRLGKEGEDIGLTLSMPRNEPKYVFKELLLTPREVTLYYNGFANSCLWPLCHNYIERAVFEEEQWRAYCQVNEKVARLVLKTAKPQDYIWVHDYHLSKVPEYILNYHPQARISLFWHVPFPPAEVFSVLPWAKECINGMLGAEMVGFHTKCYAQNFLQAAEEIAGAKVSYATGKIHFKGRIIKVVALPIGVNWREFENLANSEEVVKKAAKIRQSAGKRFILVGVDRLDYTKGIPERLRALEWLFENYPRYRDKISLIQVVVPSRTETRAYQELKKNIEETVGRINGAFTDSCHVPIRYLFKQLQKEDLAAYYLSADMALVTPVKDGLNLVAKEFVATKAHRPGVLLLSPFAGAAKQLTDALLANPFNPRETAEKIAIGLEMPASEKKRRIKGLNKVVKEQDIDWWWRHLRSQWLGIDLREEDRISLAAVQEVSPY